MLNDPPEQMVAEMNEGRHENVTNPELCLIWLVFSRRLLASINFTAEENRGRERARERGYGVVSGNVSCMSFDSLRNIAGSCSKRQH